MDIHPFSGGGRMCIVTFEKKNFLCLKMPTVGGGGGSMGMLLFSGS